MSIPSPPVNVDQDEIAKFESLTAHWWDPQGDLKALHDINDLRVEYIDARARLAGKHVLDVGCGGGILSEALAAHGAVVTGIDMAETPLQAARTHLLISGLAVTYRRMTAEAMAAIHPHRFDVVTCLELLEHVPRPNSVVTACARLLRPGGDVFFATLNRNPKSFLFAIVAAEYILRLVPRGTHRYDRFIRPLELQRWAHAAGLERADLTGLHYNPLTRRYFLGGNHHVNYLMHLKAPDH
jgi:2-polyprenyl-6-hydroxyphenyl methylase/3-demethylubiquinone-9 3-methyltransferase